MIVNSKDIKQRYN